MDATKHGIIIETETVECTVEVYINGLPAGLCGLGISNSLGRPVNEFLLDGINELALLINPGDSPARFQEPSTFPQPAYLAQPKEDPLMDEFKQADAKAAKRKAAADLAAGKRPPPPPPPPPPGGGGKRWTVLDINRTVKGIPASPGARCRCRLMRYPVGAVEGDGSGQAIQTISWDAYSIFNTLREEPQPFPRWVNTKTDLGLMFGPHAWRTAEGLRNEPRTFDGVRELVGRIREALMIGDADTVLALSTDKYREVARAYGISGDDRMQLFRQMLEMETPKLEWLFEDPEPDEFSLRIVGDSRLVECVRPDWRPIVRQVPCEDGTFVFPMLVGRTNGEWRIFR